MENIIKAFKEISIKGYLILFYGFLATIAPGFLVLYLYKPNYIKDLDSVKLIIFSSCLTLPVLMINSIAAALYMPEDLFGETKKQDEQDEFFKMCFFVGSVISFIIFYALLIIDYYIGLGFKIFLVEMVFVELIYFIPSIYTSIKYNKKHKNK